MSIQGNLLKLKKAVKNNKPVYITHGNFERADGKIAEIGNLFVYIISKDHDEPVMVEIETICEISLQKKSSGSI